jgi:hypothetical protein
MSRREALTECRGRVFAARWAPREGHEWDLVIIPFEVARRDF